MSKRKPLTERVLIKKDTEILEERGKNFFQIDFLKTVMIFLVIFDHIVAWGIKSQIGVALWERISIPVFLIIMGFNMGISFQRKGFTKLKELYSWSYFKSKILRYIIPFLVLYGFSTLIGLIFYQFNITVMYYGQYYPDHGVIQLFTGILPFWGPGNWFIPVIFGSILLFPLVYWAFTRKQVLTLIVCYAVEIVFQLFVFFFIGNLYDEFFNINLVKYHNLSIIMSSFPFYLSAIGLGLWFSFNPKPFSKRNLFIWILFPISLTYIILYQFFGFRLAINDIPIDIPLIRGDYHFLVFPYSAVLFLLVMIILPQYSENRFSRMISLIGKSTYHILLTQIFGYGIIFAWRGTHYLINAGFTFFDALLLIYAWIIFIPFGVLWYKFDQEKTMIRRLLYYVNYFLIFSVIVYTMYVWLTPPLIERVPIPLIIILIYAAMGLIISIMLKNPVKTTTLALWTSFLVYLFILTILYFEILPPNEYLIQNVSICSFFILVIVGTVLDYTIYHIRTK